jgi:hypothetical protein
VIVAEEAGTSRSQFTGRDVINAADPAEVVAEGDGLDGGIVDVAVPVGLVVCWVPPLQAPTNNAKARRETAGRR